MAATDGSSVRAFAATQFEITSERRGTVRTITVSGEIDLATVDQLDAALRGEADDELEILVVDLSGVQFIDSSGIHALVHADHRLRDQHRRLVILPAPAAVQRAFEVAGLLDVLPFAHTPAVIGLDQRL